MRLQFLSDVSDRVELEDREADRSLLAALESAPSRLLGFPWDARLHGCVLDNLGRYRRYNPLSVRDLLRVIRNKRAHWRELPPEARRLLGPPPAAFYSYFAARFPNLLLYVYRFAAQHCAADLPRYYPADEQAAQEAFARLPPADAAAEEVAEEEEEEKAAVALPLRPGEPDCAYYLKTGRCKFQDRCVFHHPPREQRRQEKAGERAGPGAA